MCVCEGGGGTRRDKKGRNAKCRRGIMEEREKECEEERRKTYTR